MIISDDLEKADVFNQYFAIQMSVNNNNNALPTLASLSVITDERVGVNKI